MNQIFGNFTEKTVSKDDLTIKFSPSSIPLNERWQSNGLSADFIAGYVTTFLFRRTHDATSMHKRVEVKSATSYITNELLENAMKYCHFKSELPIILNLQLGKNSVRFFVTNSLSPLRAANFQALIYQISHSNPQELYLNQLEKCAEDGNGLISGLGFLTMINDYSANLAWKFETYPDKPQEIVVTTMVELNV
jgi:hypothetical protein